MCDPVWWCMCVVLVSEHRFVAISKFDTVYPIKTNQINFIYIAQNHNHIASVGFTICKALVISDLILIKANLRVLSSFEQFPMTGRLVELMVDNLGIGTRYLLVVVGFGCLCR